MSLVQKALGKDIIEFIESDENDNNWYLDEAEVNVYNEEGEYEIKPNNIYKLSDFSDVYSLEDDERLGSFAEYYSNWYTRKTHTSLSLKVPKDIIEDVIAVIAVNYPNVEIDIL